MSAPSLVVVMAEDGRFQVFRMQGGRPVEVTDEYSVRLIPVKFDDGAPDAQGFHVSRKEVIPHG